MAHETTRNLADTEVTMVRMFGTTADIVHRIHHAEHERRQACWPASCGRAGIA
ncbi:hypothetical protein [Kibdelosporangium phytohabitans]|uniref:hypothetical protein n=1 Tax=Kibdelosporangium phytohabitans TaxID=860235 RepID=UPI001789D5CC|nr:hypothetical protein [Kibdelosporangium phytohabitans]MBE1466206.1 hypothetical protein [Kibdelosporangium phytohabitans]